MKRFFPILFFIFSLLFLSHTAFCAEGVLSLKEQYQGAKGSLLALQKNKELGADRENWLKSARQFRALSLSAANSEYAPACLYTLGKMYSDMFQRFGDTQDLDTARSYYLDLLAYHGNHRLADDSLYQIAYSYLFIEGQEAMAMGALEELIAKYPEGSMRVQAEKSLNILRAKSENKSARKNESDILYTKEYNGTGNNKTRQIHPVKYWSSKTYSRLVVTTSGPLDYSENMIPAKGELPPRLFLDLKKSIINREHQKTIGIEDGLLQRVRVAQYNSDTVRVVLDLDSIKNYKIFSLPDPFRIIIDIHGEEGLGNEHLQKIVLHAENKKRFITQNALYAETLKRKPSTPHNQGTDIAGGMTAGKLTLAQQLGLGVRSIVIDPGHGGKDPGAIAGGIQEKDIVLSIAQKLKGTLEKEVGAEVILTRDDDSYLSLEERTALANTAGADLFISIHANAHKQASINGLETYYLNFTTNEEAMRVAALENATSTNKMSDLEDILSEIMNNSKRDESARLADVVHDHMVIAAGDKRFYKTRNLGVKQAPFYVLIGAQMPAILVEMGFLTNTTDRRNLLSDAYQERMANQIALAIEHYIKDTNTAL